MPLLLHPIPWIMFSLLCVYVIRQWVRWVGPGEVVAPKWRAVITLAGLSFATFSTGLSVFLFIHAAFTGGYPFYHPVELFCIRFGSLTALVGLVSATVGKGRLRPHVAVVSTLNLLLWFLDAVAQ
jgi:hypothetical protein